MRFRINSVLSLLLMIPGSVSIAGEYTSFILGVKHETLAEATEDLKGPSLEANSNETPSSSDKKSKTKILPHFNKIVLSGLGNLHIVQGKEQNLSVKTEAELLPLITAEVQEGTLKLDFKNATEHSRAEVNYYLTIKDLESIQSFSSSTVYIEEGIETESLTLEIKSFGDMVVKLNVAKLVANIEGAGKIRAWGYANNQEIKIAGTGEFEGNQLSGQQVNVVIEGTGIAKVKASDSLGIKIPKEGTVRYCGDPMITKDISPKGIIQPLDPNQCK